MVCVERSRSGTAIVERRVAVAMRRARSALKRSPKVAKTRRSRVRALPRRKKVTRLAPPDDPHLPRLARGA